MAKYGYPHSDWGQGRGQNDLHSHSAIVFDAAIATSSITYRVVLLLGLLNVLVVEDEYSNTKVIV